MSQQRRTCRRWVCVALSAVLVAACSGGEPAPVGQQVLCVHPDRDALARLAAGELNPSLLEEDVVSNVLRGEAAQAQNANEPTAAGGAPLAVEFSAPPGFHAADVPLELNASDRTAAIFYTLDGSTPNPDAAGQIGCAPPLGDFRGRTYRYVGPIDLAWWLERPNNLSVVNTSVRTERLAWSEPRQRVAKAAVVRAVAIRGQHSSPPVTGTFFIDSLGRDRYSLPVVSLSTDPSNLFDEQVGIYVPGQDPDDPNYAQRGDAWERVAHLELFDQRGQRPVSQDVGIRVHGNFTRSLPQKSLRLYARKEYGSSRLRHQFFETKATTDFKRLILRNGGNDWGGTMFRDAAMQSLVQHLPLETQHAQPSVVFINGGDSKSAQMFTLVHELAYLWLGRSGVCNATLTDDAKLTSAGRTTEVWCNEVAVEVLVPLEELAPYLPLHEPLDEAVKQLCRLFKVSSLVILRRLYDAEALSRVQFDQAYKNELDRLSSLKDQTAWGGNFYNMEAARVSKRFATALLVSTLEGNTLFRDAARLLGIKKVSRVNELASRLGVV